MRRRSMLIVIALATILAVALFFSLEMWSSIGADSGMGKHGVAALAIGAIGSLILGAGLMALVFFSARRGYDDRADAANQLSREE